MKILILIFLTLRLSAQVVQPLIESKEIGDSIKVYHTQEAQLYDVNIDSVKTIWVYSYNPYDFRAGEIRDTVEVGDTLTVPKGYYWAIYAHTKFFSKDICWGSLTFGSNNLIFDTGLFSQVTYPNPNNGCFTLKIQSSAYKVKTWGMLHYDYANEGNHEFEICPFQIFPGWYFVHVRLYFNHPILKEWVITKKILIK